MPGIESNTLSASPLHFANLRLAENRQSVGERILYSVGRFK